MVIKRLPDPAGMSDSEKLAILYEYVLGAIEALDVKLEQLEKKEREKK